MSAPTGRNAIGHTSKIVFPIAMLVFCGALAYNAAKPVGPTPEQAQAAGVQSLVSANCRPQHPMSRMYDMVGVDTTLAGGIIVSHPEQLGRVCDIVNSSLVKVSLREFIRSESYKDMGRERADNTHLERLAQSLDLSNQEASRLVQEHGLRMLRHGNAQPAVHALDKESTSLNPMEL